MVAGEVFTIVGFMERSCCFGEMSKPGKMVAVALLRGSAAEASCAIGMLRIVRPLGRPLNCTNQDCKPTTCVYRPIDGTVCNYPAFDRYQYTSTKNRVPYDKGLCNQSLVPELLGGMDD
jgi:hypothetical protein